MVSFEKQKRSSNGRVILTVLMMCAGCWRSSSAGGCWVFAWKHLRRRIDERFDVLSEHLERHAAECPIREGAPAGLVPSRRSGAKRERIVPPIVRASYPGFLPTLRERVPGITPAEETLLHADQDEPEQPGDRRQDVYLHRKLAPPATG